MSEKVRTGTIAQLLNVDSTAHLLTVKNTIGRIVLRLTGDLVVVTAPVVLEQDGILNFIRRILVNLGGEAIKTIGDGSASGAAFKLLNTFNRLQYGSQISLAQPALGIGTNPFSATIVIPFEMPRNLSQDWPEGARLVTMLSPQPDDVEIPYTKE